jgi:hypothetical protein
VTGDHRSPYYDDDLLSVAEAARIAQRSVRTLRRAYLAGRMLAHRDGNGRGVTIRYRDLLAWLTADVIRPRSAAAASNPVARIDVREQADVRVQTGNLELLSAARRRRTTRARTAAVPRASDCAGSGNP